MSHLKLMNSSSRMSWKIECVTWRCREGVWRNEAVAQSSPIRLVSDSFTAVQVYWHSPLLSGPLICILWDMRGKKSRAVISSKCPCLPSSFAFLEWMGKKTLWYTKRTEVLPRFQTPTGFSLSGKAASYHNGLLPTWVHAVHSLHKVDTKYSWESRNAKVDKGKYDWSLVKSLIKYNGL